MVREFVSVYEALPAAEAEPALSMREQVTLASIVEKETGDAQERPLIAAVFLNRLRRGMRLETDPTVIYGIENFDGNVPKKHLRATSNPSNTYRIPGPPPGPLPRPGLAALPAVLEPAPPESPSLRSLHPRPPPFFRPCRAPPPAAPRACGPRGRGPGHGGGRLSGRRRRRGSGKGRSKDACRGLTWGETVVAMAATRAVGAGKPPSLGG